MQFLAAYVLKGRMQAVLVTAVIAALTAELMLYPASFFSGAAVALVTLRHGIKAGLQLSLLATLGAAALMWLLHLPPELSGAFLVALWLPVWVLAMSLRRTASQTRALMLALGFGVMALVGFSWAVADPVHWGTELQGWLVAQMTQEMPAESAAQMKDFLVAMLGEPGEMRARVVLLMVVSLIGSLLLGRWWQSLLFNPGGFGEEFRRIRLGRVAAVALLLLMVTYQLMYQAGTDVTLLRDAMLLAHLPFVLQGVAVAHVLARQHRLHPVWLVVMYMLLLLGPAGILLMLVGLLDNWFDFRSKFGRGKQTESE